MEMVQEYVKPVREFAKDSMRLVKRCTKPDLKGKAVPWAVGPIKNKLNVFMEKVYMLLQ